MSDGSNEEKVKEETQQQKAVKSAAVAPPVPAADAVSIAKKPQQDASRKSAPQGAVPLKIEEEIARAKSEFLAAHEKAPEKAWRPLWFRLQELESQAAQLKRVESELS